MSKRSILVVDDDRSVRSYLSDFLTSCGYTVECLESGDQAVARLSAGYVPSLIILDVVMPGISGIEALESIKKINSLIPVIILSAAGQTKTVVDAMKMGASDFLVKPFEEQELELAIENVVEKQKLKEEVKTLKRQLDSYFEAGDILSTNPKILKIKEIAKHVADTDVPVLISGESGVGKEVLARYIHMNSSRHDKPFVKVNCAALPNDLLESELFGYERGAFTGAQAAKPGQIELASGGVLFLDEVSELTPAAQAKFLRVLQEREFQRLGGTRLLKANIRVIASTNRDLRDAVARGAFREDLYYRLQVFDIRIPPLRERADDIPMLAEAALQDVARSVGRAPAALTHAASAVLEAYSWPGNVRQLRNVLERAAILCGGHPITPLHLELPVESSMSPAPASAITADLTALERRTIERVLRETAWNKSKAATRLGLSRSQLYGRLRRHALLAPFAS